MPVPLLPPYHGERLGCSSRFGLCPLVRSIPSPRTAHGSYRLQLIIMLLIIVLLILWCSSILAGPSFQVFYPWMPGSPAVNAAKSLKQISFECRSFELGISKAKPGPSVLDQIISLGSQAYDVYESGKYDEEIKLVTAWFLKNEFSIRRWVSSSRPGQAILAFTNSQPLRHVSLAMQPFRSTKYNHQ